MNNLIYLQYLKYIVQVAAVEKPNSDVVPIIKLQLLGRIWLDVHVIHLVLGAVLMVFKKLKEKTLKVVKECHRLHLEQPVVYHEIEEIAETLPLNTIMTLHLVDVPDSGMEAAEVMVIASTTQKSVNQLVSNHKEKVKSFYTYNYHNVILIVVNFNLNYLKKF